MCHCKTSAGKTNLENKGTMRGISRIAIFLVERDIWPAAQARGADMPEAWLLGRLRPNLVTMDVFS